MNLSKYKPISKGSGKKIEEIVNATRGKKPSDRLVKIISEIGQPEPSDAPKKDDRAAKDAET